MKFDWFITLKKSVLNFFAGLAAVIIFGMIQAMTNYKPVICSDTVVTNCTPQIISTAYYAIVPTVTMFLAGLANWLKNKDNA